MSGILHIRIVCRRKGKKWKSKNLKFNFIVCCRCFFLRYCNSFSNFCCFVLLCVWLLLLLLFYIVDLPSLLFSIFSRNPITVFYFWFLFISFFFSSSTSLNLHKDRGISKIIIFVFLHSTFDVHAIISAVIEFNSTKSIEATTTTQHEHNYLSYDKWKHNLNVQLQDVLWKLFTLQSLLYFSLFPASYLFFGTWKNKISEKCW